MFDLMGYERVDLCRKPSIAKNKWTVAAIVKEVLEMAPCRARCAFSATASEINSRLAWEKNASCLVPAARAPQFHWAASLRC